MMWLSIAQKYIFLFSFCYLHGVEASLGQRIAHGLYCVQEYAVDAVLDSKQLVLGRLAQAG